MCSAETRDLRPLPRVAVGAASEVLWSDADEEVGDVIIVVDAEEGFWWAEEFTEVLWKFVEDLRARRCWAASRTLKRAWVEVRQRV